MEQVFRLENEQLSPREVEAVLAHWSATSAPGSVTVADVAEALGADEGRVREILASIRSGTNQETPPLAAPQLLNEPVLQVPRSERVARRSLAFILPVLIFGGIVFGLFRYFGAQSSYVPAAPYISTIDEQLIGYPPSLGPGKTIRLPVGSSITFDGETVSGIGEATVREQEVLLQIQEEAKAIISRTKPINVSSGVDPTRVEEALTNGQVVPGLIYIPMIITLSGHTTKQQIPILAFKGDERLQELVAGKQERIIYEMLVYLQDSKAAAVPNVPAAMAR